MAKRPHSQTVQRVDLFRKQIKFVKDESPEVLMAGGYGTAKTVALCAKILWHATVPGALVGLTRKTFFNLKQTALRTLLYGSGTCNPLLLPGTYTHNKSDHLIRLNGGGEIYYFGCDEPERLGGINFSAVGVEEAVELDQEEWDRLVGCIRNPRGRALQIFAVTNPGGPQHFLYKRFVQCPPDASDLEKEQFDQRSYMHVGGETMTYKGEELLVDNPALPAATVHGLKAFTGHRGARYWRGEWCQFEGLCYPLNRERHGLDRAGPWKRVVLGVDKGFTNPTAVVLIGEDSDGHTHQFGELYKTGVLNDALIKRLGDLCVNQVEAYAGHLSGGVNAIVVDPSEAEFIADCKRKFQARGITVPVVGANNDRKGGIACCQNQCADDIVGRPKHTISPACECTWRELESYEIDPRTDLPAKEHDHAMDAWRYAQMWLHDAGRAAEPVLAGVVAGDERWDDDDDDWEEL